MDFAAKSPQKSNKPKGEKMKVIKKQLPTNQQEVIIVPLADLHLGDSYCDISKIKEHIEFIKNTPNAYCLLNGDIINNATRTSVSDVYGEKLTPMEQLRFASELLSPIKNKILCVTNGNHEARTYKTDGIDLMEVLTRELGIDDVYSSNSAIVYLQVGTSAKQHHNKRVSQTQYSIFVNHGCGGGHKEGGKMNKLAEMASIVDADIYVHSHTHTPMIMKKAFFRADYVHQTVTQVDKLFVNTSATLNYGGYGETFEFTPSSKETPYIRLSGKKRMMRADL